MIKKKIENTISCHSNYIFHIGNSHSKKQSLHQACIDVSFLLLPIWTSK